MILPEIAFHVIDYLADDNFVSTSNASLVCKTWRYHAQQRLFRTLTLNVHPAANILTRLQGLASSPAARIREYVRGIALGFTGELDNIQTWLVAHGKLLVCVLRMLPLAKLTRFRLDCPYVWAKSMDENTPPPEILRCIQEICAGPALRTLDINGEVPFASLLSHCGTSLKELHAVSLCTDTLSQELSPVGRQVPISLEVLHLEFLDENQSGDTSMIGFSRYILDPRVLLNFNFLRRLTLSDYLPFNDTLFNIFHACRDSLEDLTLRFLGASLAR
jgi:F-box-like